MMERDYGHGAYPGARSEAAYGGPRGESAFPGARSEAAYGGPRGESAYPGARSEANYGGPRGESAYPAARSEAAYGGPRGESAFPGARSEAAYRSSSYGLESASSKFGPYESFDSRSSLGGSDLYRSGHSYNESEPSRFADSFDDRYESSYRNSLDSFGGRNQGGASWEASLARAKMRTGFMDERGRESYSSYSGFASPPMKPAPAGSRGRGMPSFPEGALGSRSYEAFGGMPAGRGRGMGLGGMQRPGIVVDYQNKSGFGASQGGPAGRGMKRKMMPPPPNKPVAGAFANKKPKLAPPGVNANKKSDAKNEEEEEKRKIEARREKQRRRREKNSEKYGDGYRIAFTCSFCKFRTFEEKDIEAHLSSSAHKETLDHIQKQTKFDKVIMEFLHECMVNKFKKTSLRKAQTNQGDAGKTAEKDLLDGVSSDDHMMKVETVHCSACSVYVPALHASVQQHIKSSDHAKSKQAYKDQIKRESVLTATSILNNPIVKARYEMFAKGENPFEIVETPDANAGGAEVHENEGNEQDEAEDEAEDAEEEAEEAEENEEENDANDANDTGN